MMLEGLEGQGPGQLLLHRIFIHVIFVHLLLPLRYGENFQIQAPIVLVRCQYQTINFCDREQP